MIVPLYAQLLGVHIISMVVGMGAVLVVDTFGLLWLMRRVELAFVMRVAEVTQKLIWLGWTGSVVSGTALLLQKGYVDELTMIKIALVAALGLNGIALHMLKGALSRVRGNDVPLRLQMRIALTTMVSQVGWWGAIIIGWLHSHVSHEINYPSHPIVVITVACSVILVLLICERFVVRYTSKS